MVKFSNILLLNLISPLLGFNSPEISFSNVVLPEPLGPIIETNSKLFISRLISDKIFFFIYSII